MPYSKRGVMFPCWLLQVNNNFWIWGIAFVVYVLPKLRIQASCRLTSSWDTLGLIRRIACIEKS